MNAWLTHSQAAELHHLWVTSKSVGCLWKSFPYLLPQHLIPTLLMPAACMNSAKSVANASCLHHHRMGNVCANNDACHQPNC